MPQSTQAATPLIWPKLKPEPFNSGTYYSKMLYFFSVLWFAIQNNPYLPFTGHRYSPAVHSQALYTQPHTDTHAHTLSHTLRSTSFFQDSQGSVRVKVFHPIILAFSTKLFQTPKQAVLRAFSHGSHGYCFELPVGIRHCFQSLSNDDWGAL